MRRLITLVAIGMALALLALTNQPEQSPPQMPAQVATTPVIHNVAAKRDLGPLWCSRKISGGNASPKIGSRLWDLGLRTANLHATIGYDSCRRRGVGTWVLPLWWRRAVNVSGHTMPCAPSADASKPGEARGYFRTEFDTYLSDSGGRNFHPKGKYSYCHNTTNTVSRRNWFGRRTRKRLYFHAHELAPRARVNWVIRMAGSHDPEGTIRIIFKKLIAVPVRTMR